MVVVEHLPLGFSKKVDFVNYYQNALNHVVQRVSRSTHTFALLSIYKKEKYKLKYFFINSRFHMCRHMERQFW